MAHVGSAAAARIVLQRQGCFGLTKCMALELVSDGITVWRSARASMPRDLTAPLRADAQKNAALMAQTPMARWASRKRSAAWQRYICGRRRVVHDRHRHPHGRRLDRAVKP